MDERPRLTPRHVAAIVVLAFGVAASAYAAFQEPSQPFPGGNPAVPLDTSALGQTKDSVLTLGGINFTGTFINPISLGTNQIINVGAGFQFISQRSGGDTLLRNTSGPFVVAAQGLRLPNDTPANINAAFLPGGGTLIFDPTDKKVKVFNDTAWVALGVGGGGGGGVTQILAGTNITISPTSGTGVVTINASGGSSGGSSQWSGTSPGSIYYDQGNVGIGTASPANTLSVQGSIGLLRQPGASVVPGPGPAIYLESPSTAVSTVYGPNWAACSGSACGTDNTPGSDSNNAYTCKSSDAGLSYNNDISLLGGTTQRYKNSVSCVAGTSQYSLQTNAGTLQFLNNAGDAKLVIGQDGHVGIGTDTPGTMLDVAGDVSAQGFCFGTDCRNDWASLSGQWSNGTNGAISYGGGRVGIGTATPAANLDVNGTLKASTVCIGSDCKSAWPTTTSNPSTPNNSSNVYVSSNGFANNQVLWTNPFNNLVNTSILTTAKLQPWVEVSNPAYNNNSVCNHYALCNYNATGGNQSTYSNEFSADIPLDPTKAVLGIQFGSGPNGLISQSDDNAYCSANVHGYFTVAATHGAALDSMDLSGNFSPTGANAIGTTYPIAGTMNTFLDLAFDQMPNGVWGTGGNNNNPEESSNWFTSGHPWDHYYYDKPAGLNYIPPGAHLTLKSMVYNGAGTAATNSYVKCYVKVLYGDPAPTPPPVTFLVNGSHSDAQCTSGGGAIITDSSGNKFCQFNTTSCPSTWTQYNNWSETGVKNCNGSVSTCTPPFVGTSCATGSHVWGDASQESCSYTKPASITSASGGRVLCGASQQATCSATIAKIGCY